MFVLFVFLCWSMFVCVLTPLALAAPPLRYTVTTLGPAAPGGALSHPGGAGSLVAEGLDDDGSVAVTVLTDTLQQAGVLAPGGSLTLVGTLTPGWDSVASGVDGGMVVGYSYNAEGFNHAFQWTASTGLVDLNDGMILSVAQAVRGALIVGFCVSTVGLQPCLWRNGQPAVLPTLGASGGEVRGVSGAGTLVGSYQVPDRTTHALLIDADGTVVDLHPSGALRSRAVAVTSSRVVLGDAVFADVGTRLFRWDHPSGFTFLTPLPGFWDVQPHDLTDDLLLGTVYGDNGNPQRGVRWTSPTTPEDLSTLLTETGWVIYDTVQSNAAGQILAYGTKDGTADYVVLLTPAPSPGAPERKKKTHHWQHREHGWHAER